MRMVDAAVEALKTLGGGPATPKQIYDEIVRQELFSFGAKSPVSVLSGSMREKTEGSPRLKGDALFVSAGSGLYALK